MTLQGFEFHRARDSQDALRWAQSFQAAGAAACYIAGGTNLVDYMTLDVTKPPVLIDINGLREAYGRIEFGRDRLRLGALVRMGEAEEFELDEAGRVIHRRARDAAETTLVSFVAASA